MPSITHASEHSLLEGQGKHDMSADESDTNPATLPRQRVESLARSRDPVDRALAASDLAGTEDAWAVPLLDALQRDPDPAVAEAARVTVTNLTPALRSAVRRIWFASPTITSSKVAVDADGPSASARKGAATRLAPLTEPLTANQTLNSESAALQVTPVQRAIWTAIAPILDECGATFGQHLVSSVQHALAHTHFEVGVEEVKDAVMIATARGDATCETAGPASHFSTWQISLAADYRRVLGVADGGSPPPAPGNDTTSARHQVPLPSPSELEPITSDSPSIDHAVIAVVDRALAVYGRFIINEVGRDRATADYGWSDAEIRTSIIRLVNQHVIARQDVTDAAVDDWLLRRRLPPTQPNLLSRRRAAR